MAIRKAILYARVSTDNQADKGYSLPSQLDACRRYAEQHGFEIVGEFQEDYTGTIPLERRPEGRKVYAMLSGNQADVIVAYTVDRLVRPPEEGDEWDFPVLIRGLALLDKEIHTCDIGKLKTDFASLLIAMLGAKGAGDERRKIIERTARGRNEKASRHGKVVGSNRAPYGYRFVRDAFGKVFGLEIYEPHARIVRLIFKWYVHGDDDGTRLSLWAIGNKLTKLKVQTPGENRADQIKKDKIRVTKSGRELKLRRGVWSSTSISNIIKNESYAGTWRYGQRIGEGGSRGRRSVEQQIAVSIPAIVDRATWEQAQAQRKRNAALSKRNGKRDYLLRGYLKCTCGRSMSGCFDGRSELTTHRRYRCVSICYRKRGEVCREKSIAADFAETFVWERIRQKFEHPEKLRSDLKASQAQAVKGDETKRAELEAVNEMIAEVDREIEELGEMKKVGGHASDVFQKQIEDANARYASHVKRRDELLAEIGSTGFSDEEIEETVHSAEDIREGIEHATFDDKRRWMERLRIVATVKDGAIVDLVGVIAFQFPSSATSADAA